MLAIIPARGGSKGLPGKNIKLLHGKPLIAYTIEAAFNAKSISQVVVSTDDDEIARIAVMYGAKCPFKRPEDLATDNALSIDVYRDTIDRLEKEDSSITIKEFVVLQPTSPLRTSEDIDNAIGLFIKKNADSVISYCAEHHPIKWHKYIDKNGQFTDIFEDTLNNRQDNRVSYYPNGAIYVLKRSLLCVGTYYTKCSFAYIMDRSRSVDIDTIEDFEYAEFLINKSQ